MRAAIICFVLSSLALGVQAQEHPFLSSFTVEPGFGTIELNWTMISGNTCFGIRILRSADGIDFEDIGKIEGLCGNLSEPVDYSFTDEAPDPFTQHYYRLELGVNGLSSIQDLYYDQVMRSEQLVVYSTEGGAPVIYLGVPIGSDAVITLYEVTGKVILTSVVTDGQKISLPAGSPSGGILVYRILIDGVMYNGRVLNLI